MKELIPKKILIGLPKFALVKISPDGKKISYLKLVDDVLNIWVRDEKGERQLTFEKERSIIRYLWAKDSEHIIFLKDYDGDENWHLYLLNIDTGEIKDLTPYENVQVKILASTPLKKDEILIEMNKRDPSVHDVYRLNVKTGEIKLVMENPGNLMTGVEGGHGWVTDNKLNIKAGHFAGDDGSIEFKVLENGKWRKVLEWPAEDNFISTALHFISDDEVYIMDTFESGNMGISLLNVKTLKRQKIYFDNEFDIHEFISHPFTGKILAVNVYKESAYWTAISEEVKEDIEFLNRNLEGDYIIRSQSDDNKVWIIGFTRDDTPHEYYLYDRENKKLEFLFSTRPELKEYKLNKKEPVWIKSRDGLDILCYITFPDTKEKKNLPLVLKVHGGPWWRDFWNFDPESQWLSNRGYICLEVNFRGSTGFGKKFMNAGDKEWGRKMLYDLIDAAKWCIEKGYADPERIGIIGASYGGYASLCAAAFAGDFFKCAISLCGISNLITFIKSIPPYWKTYYEVLRKRIGDPEKEEEFLKSRSPYFHADKINIPVLIFQGGKDVRVKKEESEQIVKALKERDKEVKYILFENEGHGPVIQENILKFYEESEKFLAKHLGGKCE